MHNANISTQASLGTRAKVWFESLPIFTRAVFAVCVGIYILGALAGFDNYGAVCLVADRVLWHGEVWRFVTAAVFHTGLLHVAFNMLAFVPIGGSLERSLGTVPFAHLVGVLAGAGGSAFVFFSFVAAFGPASLGGNWVRQCAVGLSGVIFGLIVADNAISGATHRSIFGIFNVPAPAYPWALLLFWQLLMPGASFLGHLCGVLMGQLYVWGFLKWMMLPMAAVRWVEGTRVLAPLYARPCFIAVSGPSASAGAPGPALPSQAPASGVAQAPRWFNAEWLRMPGRGGASSTAFATGHGAGLFGLGGAAGTGTAPAASQWSGRPQTLGQQGPPRQQPVPPPPHYPVTGAPHTERTPLLSASAHSQGGQDGGLHDTAADGFVGQPTATEHTAAGRQLDPVAGGARQALAARAAAAAAAEARAKGHPSPPQGAGRTSSGSGGSSGGGGGGGGTNSDRAGHQGRQQAAHLSPAAAAAELRALGIGGTMAAPETARGSGGPDAASSRAPVRIDSGARRPGGGSGSTGTSPQRHRARGGQLASGSAAVTELTRMGFAPVDAAAALDAADGDVALAVDILTSN